MDEGDDVCFALLLNPPPRDMSLIGFNGLRISEEVCFSFCL